MSAREQYLAMDMTSIAQANNFILVYPEGSTEIGSSNTLIWNSGPYQELSQTKASADDLSYVEDLINELQRLYSINASKIYVTGFSNGGFMVYALACYKSDLFAAIAPIAAIMTQEALSESSSNPCNPDKNLPVIHFHGTNDYIVNINFGYQARDFWKQRHQAFNEEIINLTDSQNSRQVQHFKYSNGLSETVVEFVKIHNGYHETFQSMDVDEKNSSQMIWDFFNRF